MKSRELFSLITIALLATCHHREDGERITYFETGSIKTIERLDSLGYLDGLQEEYFESGKLKKALFYRNGLLHGQITEYYENDQIKEVLKFKYDSLINMLKFDSGGALEVDLSNPVLNVIGFCEDTLAFELIYENQPFDSSNVVIRTSDRIVDYVLKDHLKVKIGLSLKDSNLDIDIIDYIYNMDSIGPFLTTKYLNTNIYLDSLSCADYPTTLSDSL